jgi:hypothetical protein
MIAMSQPSRRLAWRRSAHPFLGLFLIIAISACALWRSMDLLVRATGIDWPI